ncbi:MAG TPA: hypothetical protein VGJ37_00305 [Pyrinomonadaceae bacterium]|jgi:signal transduction histidine kinase
MAKRKRLQQLPRSASNKTTSPSEVQRGDSGSPFDRDERTNRIRTAAAKFGEWALSKALDYLLVGVLALGTAPAFAIWVYLRSGRAAWTYPWLYAALGFTTACLVIVLMASLLSLIESRRKRIAERAINLEFLSKDKGYLDHAVNQAKAFKTFNSLMNGMAEVMARIARTNSRATIYIRLAQRSLAQRPNLLAFIAHKIAARTAKKLNSHAAAMESYLTKIELTSNLLIESITGYTTWFPVGTDEQAEVLMGEVVALEKMLAVIRTTVSTTESFRDSQEGLYGVSQELNTAINRMINVSEGIARFFKNSVTRWSKVISLMKDKLATRHR